MRRPATDTSLIVLRQLMLDHHQAPHSRLATQVLTQHMSAQLGRAFRNAAVTNDPGLIVEIFIGVSVIRTDLDAPEERAAYVRAIVDFVRSGLTVDPGFGLGHTDSTYRQPGVLRMTNNLL